MYFIRCMTNMTDKDLKPTRELTRTDGGNLRINLLYYYIRDANLPLAVKVKF